MEELREREIKKKRLDEGERERVRRGLQANGRLVLGVCIHAALEIMIDGRRWCRSCSSCDCCLCRGVDVRRGRADGNLVILGRIEAGNRGLFRVLHRGQERKDPRVGLRVGPMISREDVPSWHWPTNRSLDETKVR